MCTDVLNQKEKVQRLGKKTEQRDSGMEDVIKTMPQNPSLVS